MKPRVGEPPPQLVQPALCFRRKTREASRRHGFAISSRRRSTVTAVPRKPAIFSRSSAGEGGGLRFHDAAFERALNRGGSHGFEHGDLRHAPSPRPRNRGTRRNFSGRALEHRDHLPHIVQTQITAASKEISSVLLRHQVGVRMEYIVIATADCIEFAARARGTERRFRRP